MPKNQKPIWVKWNPKDALDGMQPLDVWEELAYRRILDFIYTTNDQLPDDDKRMARMTRVGRRWPKVKAALLELGKIEVINGRISNAVCRKKLEAWCKKSVENTKRNYLKSNKTWSNSGTPNGTRTAPEPPLIEEVKKIDTLEPNGSKDADASADLDAVLYRRGRELLGKNQGAMITKLKRATGSVGAALDALELAKRKDDPGAYIAGICQNKTSRADRAKAEIEQGYQRWRESNERG